MNCTSPTQIKSGQGIISVPCGQCVACRIQRSKEWKIRCLFELKSFDDVASFVTLTYDDEHLPSNCSLVKADFQKFMKRLRRDVPTKLKYYACGEYGEKTGRPHYHAIIFGLSPNETTRQLLKDNWRLCDSFRFNGLKSGLAEVTADSIGYVTGYIHKKVLGKGMQEAYIDKGLCPPFSLMSKSIGLKEFIKHLDQYNKVKGIIYNGSIMGVNRYFYNKLGLSDWDSSKCLEDKVAFLRENNYSDDVIFSLARRNLLAYEFDKLNRDRYRQKQLNDEAKLAIKEYKKL